MAATAQRQDFSRGAASRAGPDSRAWPENRGSGANGAASGFGAGDVAQMAKALGWFRLGLGLPQRAAPRQVAQVIGLPGDNHEGLVRLCQIEAPCVLLRR
jgi:hypothetical protein